MTVHADKEKTGMVRIRKDYLDLGQICDSGQCFRMEKQNDGKFAVTAGNHYLEIEQNKEELQLYCSQAEFGGFWKMYFDLETDYGQIQERLDSGDSYLKQAAAFGRGIRILRQDPWEMVITFIVSQQNHIRRIRRIIRLLCETYGERRDYSGEGGAVSRDYYAFPEPERLARADMDTLRECNLGYRARYVKETARQIAEGEKDLAQIARMNYPEAKKALMGFCGVGEKVADCICLFGLHRLEAFPVDTHIRQILALHYPDGFPAERYRGFEGVIQQYMFYYDLFGDSCGHADRGSS